MILWPKVQKTIMKNSSLNIHPVKSFKCLNVNKRSPFSDRLFFYPHVVIFSNPNKFSIYEDLLYNLTSKYELSKLTLSMLFRHGQRFFSSLYYLHWLSCNGQNCLPRKNELTNFDCYLTTDCNLSEMFFPDWEGKNVNFGILDQQLIFNFMGELIKKRN
jgi:hypothetical protein